jgi:hypothetical protein
MHRYYNYQYDYSQQMTDEQEVNSFLKRHEATAGLSRHKLYARRIPVRYNEWLQDGGPIPFDQAVEREPMVEINMPQERFRSLVERERWYGKMEQEAEYYKRIVDQLRADERVRDDNPAVQKAWKNYLMLLELAR